MHLGQGRFLQGGKYEIVRYISSGGFGCTYEARHTLFRKTVAIKEFFVKDFCNRNERGIVEVATQGKVELVNKLRAKFIDEATALYELQHPNIVRVTDVFEENGTAYYVMEYIDGLSLADLISQKGALAESEALGYICQVADALSYVHSKNRLHLDVKPGNIMIDHNGKAVLIDFGVSKQYDEVSGENTSTLMGYSRYYAPIEQTSRGVREFSPTTDIYSLGATLYKLVTGQTPPEASDINEDGVPALPLGISASVRETIEVAMQPKRKDRPQSIEEFLGKLKEQRAKSKAASFDNTSSDSSSTPGGEVSRSDGGETELSKLKTASFDDETVCINPPCPLDTPPLEKVGEFSRTIIHENDETCVNSSSTPGGEQTESTKKSNKGKILAFVIAAMIFAVVAIGFVAKGSDNENDSYNSDSLSYTSNDDSSSDSNIYSEEQARLEREAEAQRQREEEERIAREQQQGISTSKKVDLGLSVCWAEWNVGASAPEEYGGYYAWGETEEKSNYDWSTYKWYKGSNDTLTKYCTDGDYGTVDNKPFSTPRTMLPT